MLPSDGSAPPPVTLAPADPPASPQAIISLIAGIAGFSLVPVIGSIIAVIFGHMGRRAAKRDPRTVGGKGLATIGLVLGYLGLSTIFLVIAIILVALVTGSLFLLTNSR